MKLLDPFAGYRLASGHPFFHLALFGCSFFAEKYGKSKHVSVTEIVEAFNMLRWAHFILFVLAIFSAMLEKPSKIPAPDADTEKGADEDEDRTRLKIYHRDGSKKLFSRILSTISVFIYQGSVFYAQMVLANQLIDCDTSGSCVIKDLKGNRMHWLVLETCCFYLYVLSTTGYIIWRMVVGMCFRSAEERSDMYKALNDFIEYAAINLTWFAFNFVLVTMPPIVIFWLQDEKSNVGMAGGDETITDEDGEEEKGSFVPIMYTLWAMHILHFMFQLRIYMAVEKDSSQLNNAGQLSSNFAKDDNFKFAETNKLVPDAGNSILPSESMQTISFTDHYVPMTRAFSLDHWYIWVLNSTVIIGCLIAFIFVDGKELIYQYYIPLDISLNICKTIFFWYNYWVDKVQKDDAARLAKRIQRKSEKRVKQVEQLKEPLMGVPADDDKQSQHSNLAPPQEFDDGQSSASSVA